MFVNRIRHHRRRQTATAAVPSSRATNPPTISNNNNTNNFSPFRWLETTKVDLTRGRGRLTGRECTCNINCVRRRSVRGEWNGILNTIHIEKKTEQQEGHGKDTVREQGAAADKKGDKYIRFKLNFLLTEANNSDRAKEGNPISDRRTDVRKHVHKHRILISGHLLYYHPPLQCCSTRMWYLRELDGQGGRKRAGETESERSLWLFW